MNTTILQVLGLYVFLNFKYLSKYFAQIYRDQYGAAMLVCASLVPNRSIFTVKLLLKLLFSEVLHGRNNRFFFPWEKIFFLMLKIFIVPVI